MSREADFSTVTSEDCTGFLIDREEQLLPEIVLQCGPGMIGSTIKRYF